MCGLFGWLKFENYGDLSEKEIMDARLATSSLKHRGPDDFGEWKKSNLYMGHHRLRILDLSQKAAQPFLSSDGRFILSYNGEIYNFIELRKELQQKGFSFHTDSDTEVFLNSFIAWGTEGFLKMEGMFAAAIHDTKTNKHYLARDHLGQKPLYFHRYNCGIVYASELRALLQLKSFNWQLEKNNFVRFLMTSYYSGDKTPLKNVFKLLPGHFISIHGNTVEPKPYWDSIPGEHLLNIGINEAVSEFETLFKRACQISMRSDVPYGVLLSGGIDSSMALRSCLQISADVDAFSIAMSEVDFDESSKAKQIAKYLGVHHHNLFTLNEKIINQELKNYLNTLDEPHGDPGFINMLFLSKSCAKKITVAISGDGGDELFAGYQTFSGLRFLPFINKLPMFAQSCLTKIAEVMLPASDKYLGLQFKALAYFQGFPSSNIMRYPLWLSSLSLEEIEKLCPNHPKEFFKPSGSKGTIFDYEGTVMNKMKDRTPTQQLLYFYQKVFLPEFVCLHSDRASMQSSLEVRSPFLTRSIIEFANRLPDHFKIEGNTLKRLLKLTACKWSFPPKITNQKKQGFTFPVARWLKTELKPIMHDLAQDESLDELVDKNMLNQLMLDHLSGKKNHYRILFNIMTFSAWKQKFPKVEI